MLGTSWLLLHYNPGARNPKSLKMGIKEWGQRALINLNYDQSGQPSIELNKDRPDCYIGFKSRVLF